MAVGDFARSFRDAAQQAGLGSLVPGVAMGWLSGRGHLEPGASTAPPQIRDRLAAIYTTLGGREDLLAAKKSAATTVDFAFGENVLVELDEIQHFTAERLLTLRNYEGMTTTLDLVGYQILCSQWQSDAGRAWAKKEAVDFPFPGGRRAQRAYLDTVRDLLAPAFGFELIRVPAPEGQVSLAVERLRTALNQ